VPTYIMLSTLTPEGVQTVKNNPARIREVNKEVEQLGATVKAQWATLGHFDFINIVEAPDDLTVTSDAAATVGSVVTFAGTIAVDKDFGAGYAYPVMLESGAIVAE